MKTIELKASNLLENNDLLATPINVKLLIRKLKIKLDSVDFGSEISGILYSENGKTKIGYNEKESEVRQRFTMAHELGHYVLHLNENQNKMFLDNVKVMFRKQAVTRIEKNQEREANIFAASLLMPEILVNKRFEQYTSNNQLLTHEEIISKLAKEFKVSEVAMTYRLMNIKLIEQYH